MTETDVDEVERRRFPRVKAEVYYREPRVAPLKRPIYDISLGGVRIHCDEKLKKNQQLELEFFLPNGYVLVAIARVVWIRELPEGSNAVYAVGMEFMHLNPDAAGELQKFLSSA
jgi:c-di-GMP-binding flagellar brake protein YcgR